MNVLDLPTAAKLYIKIIKYFNVDRDYFYIAFFQAIFTLSVTQKSIQITVSVQTTSLTHFLRTIWYGCRKRLSETSD